MVRLQRELAEDWTRQYLMVRDVGTVVTPDACTKIFLTASRGRAGPDVAGKELREKGYSNLYLLRAAG